MLDVISYVAISTEQYCLVYWQDEDAVSVVSERTVKDPKVGKIRYIVIKNKSYEGKVEAMSTSKQLNA